MPPPMASAHSRGSLLLLLAALWHQLPQGGVQAHPVKHDGLIHLEGVLIHGGAGGAHIHRPQLQALVCTAQRSTACQELSVSQGEEEGSPASKDGPGRGGAACCLLLLRVR